MTTTAPALPTCETFTGDAVTFKPVRVSVTVELVAYVPVDWESYQYGDNPPTHASIEAKIADEVQDAVIYRAPSHTDFEDHDALLVIEEAEVAVFPLADVDPARALSSENLNSLVEGRAGEL